MIHKTTLDKARLINRKTFLRLATSATMAAFVGIWFMLTGRQKQLSEKPEIRRINAAILGTGVFMYDNYIIVKSVDGLKVFSNRCTHAGCRINRVSDGLLICPCHGSKYKADSGKVVQGPAVISLPQIPFSTDAKTGEIIINI